MSRFRLILGLFFAASVVACASASTAKPATGARADFITTAELANSGASNAYEAVTRLRPNWLRDRGTASMARGEIRNQVVAIFLDGQRLGDLQSLTTLSITGMKSMQWLDAARAATVLSGLGSEAVSGAILMKSR